MKCINKVIPFALAGCVLLSGCGSRADLEDAYDLYGSTGIYENLGSDSADTLSLFASDLCTGGTENTESEETEASSVGSSAVFSVSNLEITYAQNIYEQMYPASITKILTAYIALKYGDTGDVITVSSEALDELSGTGSSTCGLEAGDELTLDTLLYGLLLCSGNDAAVVIAEYISGSTEEFADLMNSEAEALGATGSHFTNPHGLTDEDHYTTAYDLYLIFNAAVQNEEFVKYISASSYEASYTNSAGEDCSLTWENTNKYISGDYDMPDGITIIGGKTGTTSAAGSCLILYGENTDGDQLISIVLNASSGDELYSYMTTILESFGL